jgi:hypothetical protein
VISHSLDVETSHLKRTFRCNGHNNLEIVHVLASKQRPQAQKERPAGKDMLKYQQPVSNKINRLLSKHNIKTTYL